MSCFAGRCLIRIQAEYLVKELERSLIGQSTPPCDPSCCRRCGVCGEVKGRGASLVDYWYDRYYHPTLPTHFLDKRGGSF